MNNDEPREAIAVVMRSADEDALGCCKKGFNQLVPVGQEAYLMRSDAVIKHLWEKASNPEVVEAVARFGIVGWDDYTPDGPIQEGAREMAKGEIAELLTALIGPPPSDN